MLWSFILAAGGITGIWLAGRNNLWGWALGLAMQVGWIGYALYFDQYGFIFSAIAYGAVYSYNWWKWDKANKEEMNLREISARAFRKEMEDEMVARRQREAKRYRHLKIGRHGA